MVGEAIILVQTFRLIVNSNFETVLHAKHHEN